MFGKAEVNLKMLANGLFPFIRLRGLPGRVLDYFPEQSVWETVGVFVSLKQCFLAFLLIRDNLSPDNRFIFFELYDNFYGLCFATLR